MYPLLRHTRGSERLRNLPKVTQSVCMEPTHKPKESDPSIGSLNNYREMVGADQCCLVAIFCKALLPFLFLTPFSAPASNRGCLQRGGWAGRVETRSLKGPPLGTDTGSLSNSLWNCMSLVSNSVCVALLHPLDTQFSLTCGYGSTITLVHLTLVCHVLTQASSPTCPFSSAPYS